MIAGDLRGRRLETPAGRVVRPTSDRVREALFDILGARVRGAALLEVFAGSGAVGIEALSRGAAQVVFIESSREALRALEKNLDKLGLEPRSSIVSAPWPEGLARARSPITARVDSTSGRLRELDEVPSIGLNSADWAGSIPALSPGRFDIVFADPPYHGAPYREILESLSAPGLLREGAFVVVEHEARTSLPESAGALQLDRIARYGRSALAFYERMDVTA